MRTLIVFVLLISIVGCSKIVSKEELTLKYGAITHEKPIMIEFITEKGYRIQGILIDNKIQVLSINN